MRREIGRNNVLFIHVTLLPALGATGELKTKPTQQSVRELRSAGIQPDVIVCRSDSDIPDDVKEKIALFCDVDRDAVIPMPTASTIYEVPLLLQESGVDELIDKRLDLQSHEPELDDWREMVERLKNPERKVRVAIVGKYVELHDAYMSVTESLTLAGLVYDARPEFVWVNSETMSPEEMVTIFRTVQGIVVPGGFGPRGTEGKIVAAQYCRETGTPYLGLCYGLHMAVIEVARNACGSGRTPTHPRSMPTRRIRSSASCLVSTASRWVAPCASVSGRANSCPVRKPPQPMARSWSRNGTATDSKSTTTIFRCLRSRA